MAESAQLQRTGTDKVACPHLGLHDDPFKHATQPSSDHRCYLWMQRDRIDQIHQRSFCLTAHHKRCPWLTFTAVPQRQPASLRRRAAEAFATLGERFQEGIDELDYGSRRRELLLLLVRIALAAVQCAGAGWRLARPVLGQLGAWLLVLLALLGRYLRRAGSALWRARPRRADQTTYRPVARSITVPEPVSDALEEPAAACQRYLTLGAEAVGAGGLAAALRCFRLATQADEGNEQAWLWRGALAETGEEKVHCFNRVLAINPHNVRARSSLIELGLPVPRRTISAQPGETAIPQGDALSATWFCEHCAATNPTATIFCRQCGTLSAHTERELVAGGPLFERAVAAMHLGSEELAYHFFTLVTEKEPANEVAWYWRARTAPTPAELIRSLRQILEINPANAKAQADLEWALRRQEREQDLQIHEDELPEAPSSEPAGFVVALRRAAVHLASLATYVLGLLFCLPLVVSLTRLALIPSFEPYVKLLPAFSLPVLPVRVAFVALDLGTVIPFALGLLLLHAAFRLASDGNWGVRLWAGLLGIMALGFVLVFVRETLPLGLITALIVIAAVSFGHVEPLARDQKPAARHSPAAGSV